MIGIDKITLKNLGIKEVDTNILRINGFQVTEGNADARKFINKDTGELIPIEFIRVTEKYNQDTIINDLRIGKMEIEGIKNIEYERMDIALPRVISSTKTNENNVSSTTELTKSVERIQEELEVLGFGKVYLSDTDVKEIELNANIELEGVFKDYQRVFEYLRQLLPNGIKTYKNDTYEPKGAYTGFTVANGSVKLKFYDKRKNIIEKYGMDLEKELLRLEYSFMNEQKIQSEFGSNEFKEVTKDFEVIEEVFKRNLRADLITKLHEDIRRQERHAMRRIREYKRIGGISAVDNYLKNHQADLLDIEIVLAALRKTEISNHYSVVSKRAIKSAEEVEGVKMFGNINKLNEILEKLGFEKIDLNITSGIRKEVKKHY